MMIMVGASSQMDRRAELNFSPALHFSSFREGSKNCTVESQKCRDRVQIGLCPPAECLSHRPSRALCRSCKKCPEFHPVVDDVERQEFREMRVASDAFEVAVDKHPSEWA